MKMVIAIALLAFPFSVAAAAECTSDADCAADEVCERIEMCAAPACPDDQECPPPDCTSGGVCVAGTPSSPDYVYGNECEADADCPAGFTCEEVQVPCAVPATCGCSCPACDPDDGECPPCECSGCEAPEPGDCEPITTTYCAFHPQDCTADSDCAEGFQCVVDEVCSGGGATGCAVPDCACACEGGDCPPCECPEPVCDDLPIPSETSCDVVGQYCAPKQIACADATDCPAQWECVAMPTYGCTCPMIDCPPVEVMCPDMDPACVEKAKACDEAAACDCPDTEPESWCLPQGWGGVLDAQRDDGGTGVPTAGPTGGSELDDFLANAQEAAAGSHTGSDKDDGGADTTGGSDVAGGDGNAVTGGTTPSGDCSVGGTGHGLALFLLGLLALAGVTVVRRRA